jgi:hypothetical protein
MAGRDALASQNIEAKIGYKKLFEFDMNGNPIYLGMAEPGVTTDKKNWSIRKIAWDVDGNPESIMWANGSREFKFVWDNRSSYTYT